MNTAASPAFLAINPIGADPGDDGWRPRPVGELCHHHVSCAGLWRGAGSGLSDAEAALMEQWSLFAISAVEGPALDIRMTLDKGVKGPEAEAFVAISAEKLRRPLAHLAQALKGVTGWWAGALRWPI